MKKTQSIMEMIVGRACFVMFFGVKRVLRYAPHNIPSS